MKLERMQANGRFVKFSSLDTVHSMFIMLPLRFYGVQTASVMFVRVIERHMDRDRQGLTRLTTAPIRLFKYRCLPYYLAWIVFFCLNSFLLLTLTFGICIVRLLLLSLMVAIITPILLFKLFHFLSVVRVWVFTFIPLFYLLLGTLNTWH